MAEKKQFDLTLPIYEPMPSRWVKEGIDNGEIFCVQQLHPLDYELLEKSYKDKLRECTDKDLM